MSYELMLDDRRERAVEECKARYGHTNACLVDVDILDGHFYAGQEETRWVVHPQDDDGVGVSEAVPGSYCLCCFVKQADGSYMLFNRLNVCREKDIA